MPQLHLKYRLHTHTNMYGKKKPHTHNRLKMLRSRVAHIRDHSGAGRFWSIVAAPLCPHYSHPYFTLHTAIFYAIEYTYSQNICLGWNPVPILVIYSIFNTLDWEQTADPPFLLIQEGLISSFLILSHFTITFVFAVPSLYRFLHIAVVFQD